MKTKNTPPPVSRVTQSSSRKSELCAAAIMLTLLASNTPSQAQSYGITDLGTLAGTNKSVGYGLNQLGQAVGVSSNPTAAIATLFSNGKTTNMNTLGADVSVATSIGGSGQAAGYNIFDSSPNPIFRAFLYSSGSMTDIQSDSLFPSGTQAHGINGSGEVVGEGWLTSSSFHAFLYSGGRMVDLGGGYQATASAINDAGQIVGNPFRPGKHVGFIYRNGVLVDLNTLTPSNSGFTITDAVGINDSGQILCTATNTSGSAHAVLLTPK